MDLERLATSTGAGYRRVETGEDLAEVLAEPPLGIEVVEAVIDRRLRRMLDNEIGSLTVAV